MAAASQHDELTAVLERHRAFWLRAPVDRPLLRIVPYEEWKPYAAFVRRDGSILPHGAEIKPGLLAMAANLEPGRPQQMLDADFVCGWGPLDLCWTEAIMGCRVLRGGPSVWSEPFIEDWAAVDGLAWAGNSPWLDELLAINQWLVQESAGVYPVCQPLMRGPLDMAEGVLPSALLYAGFYENPAQLRKLLHLCAKVFVDVGKRRLAQTPPWHGGYMVRYEWGLWAPGPTIQFQADASRNLSPAKYREFLVEIDREIIEGFEFSIIHTHSGSSHILPVLVEEPGLRAIEVALDPAPYGPPPPQLLPRFKLVQEAGKSLYIGGPLKRSELDLLLENLSPTGLAIRAGILPE